MIEKEHPLKLAALAVVGTMGVCTLVVFQWVLPTMTASSSHEISALKEKLTATNEESAKLRQDAERSFRRTEEEKRRDADRVAALSEENRALRDRLFQSEQANTFMLGDPYPVGIDRVRVGNVKEKIYEVFGHDSITETGRTLAVKRDGDTFRRIHYRHSATRSSAGKIDSIRYELRSIERTIDESLPKIPKEWLEGALRKALGEPYVVGLDNGCLFWKKSDMEGVYYLTKSDWFEVSGFVTYPPGCSISEEQLQAIIKSRSPLPR